MRGVFTRDDFDRARLWREGVDAIPTQYRHPSYGDRVLIWFINRWVDAEFDGYEYQGLDGVAYSDKLVEHYLPIPKEPS